MTDVVEQLKARAAPLTRARELSPTAALCREAANEIERLRARIRDLESAKVSIDVDSRTDGNGHRVFGRVVDWQPEDYEDGGAGKGIGVRLLCEYDGDNFGMTTSPVSSKDT
jgi:hypothetical protein